MQREIIDLFRKHINNECTREELDRVLSLIKSGACHDEWEAAIAEDAAKVMAEVEARPLSAREARDLHGHIRNRIRKHRREVVFPLWLRYSAAAAVLIIAATALFLYSGKDMQAPPAEVSEVAIDAPPGGDVATLTLADGSQIKLDEASDGDLAIQGGAKIVKDEGQLAYLETGQSAEQTAAFNTLTTPRGGQYQIVLPDGSKAWLNAASSIIYPVAFDREERHVEVTGEVYFEVVHEPLRPFKVSTAGQTVEVLGTHFNINAYPDEGAIRTTLIEGSVRVTSTATSASRLLLPGQQSVIDGAKEIAVHTVDLEPVTGWKEGFIYFEGAELKAVMRQLARWYKNIEIDMEGMPHRKLSGIISRNVNFSVVLDAIEKTSDIQLKVRQSSSGQPGWRVSME